MSSILRQMPQIEIDQIKLFKRGKLWLGTKGSKSKNGNQTLKKPNRFDRKQSMDFGNIFDMAFGRSVALMLGDIPVVKPKNDSLLPPVEHANCVEVGKTRIVGGIRPQNFDAAYRPDGPRIVYDSKTLNDTLSIGKNWQNMIMI